MAAICTRMDVSWCTSSWKVLLVLPPRRVSFAAVYDAASRTLNVAADLMGADRGPVAFWRSADPCTRGSELCADELRVPRDPELEVGPVIGASVSAASPPSAAGWYEIPT